jgi:hypothetical protein
MGTFKNRNTVCGDVLTSWKPLLIGRTLTDDKRDVPASQEVLSIKRTSI